MLQSAWKQVKANGGSVGADKVSIEEIETYGVDKFLEEIKEDLLKGTYIQRPLFDSYKTRRLIRYFYKAYPKGFYVNAKRKLDDTRQAVNYIGRYLARAAIAEYRIIKYENNRVKFWYLNYLQEEVIIIQFTQKYLHALLFLFHKFRI